MHHLVVLLFKVTALAVIFLLIELFLVVLLFATRVIMALILAMATVVWLFVMIRLVALMVVTVLATMIPVVQVTVTSNGKMSHLLFFWLLLLLELVKEVGRFIGSLTLLKKGHKPKRVCAHCLVHFLELKLMHLGLQG